MKNATRRLFLVEDRVYQIGGNRLGRRARACRIVGWLRTSTHHGYPTAAKPGATAPIAASMHVCAVDASPLVRQPSSPVKLAQPSSFFWSFRLCARNAPLRVGAAVERRTFLAFLDFAASQRTSAAGHAPASFNHGFGTHL
jgi:hypothetical protein